MHHLNLATSKDSLKGRKKVKLKRKSAKNQTKNEPSPTSMRRMVPENDVTDAILQDIEKMKVQYLMSLLFDLFEILEAVRSDQTNVTRF